MIEITPREEQIIEAIRQANEMSSKYYRNSHTNNVGAKYGHLAEILFQEKYPKAIKTMGDDMFFCDFWIEDKKGTMRSVDIKSRSQNISYISGNHLFTDKRLSTSPCDFYYFYVIHKSMTLAWDIGYLSFDEYNRLSIQKPPGFIQPNGEVLRAGGNDLETRHVRGCVWPTENR